MSQKNRASQRPDTWTEYYRLVEEKNRLRRNALKEVDWHEMGRYILFMLAMTVVICLVGIKW